MCEDMWTVVYNRAFYSRGRKNHACERVVHARPALWPDHVTCKGRDSQGLDSKLVRVT